jgi:hypothetical protein
MTLGAVLLAKVLIVALTLPELTRDEVPRSRQATTNMFMVDTATHRSFSPENGSRPRRFNQERRDHRGRRHERHDGGHAVAVDRPRS